MNFGWIYVHTQYAHKYTHAHVLSIGYLWENGNRSGNDCCWFYRIVGELISYLIDMVRLHSFRFTKFIDGSERFRRKRCKPLCDLRIYKAGRNKPNSGIDWTWWRFLYCVRPLNKLSDTTNEYMITILKCVQTNYSMEIPLVLRIHLTLFIIHPAAH